MSACWCSLIQMLRAPLPLRVNRVVLSACCCSLTQTLGMLPGTAQRQPGIHLGKDFAASWHIVYIELGVSML